MNIHRIRLVVLGILATLGLVATCWIVRRNDFYAHAPQAINVHLADVISGISHFRGRNSGMFYLVEFGDFQCPPCATVAPLIENLRAKNAGKLEMYFRENPLSIHPLAKDAAICAEAAGDNFWAIHDLLYKNQGQLSKKYISDLQASFHPTKIDVDTAALQVAADMEDATRLQLNYTPALLLVDVKGEKIYNIKNLGQVQWMLDHS